MSRRMSGSSRVSTFLSRVFPSNKAAKPSASDGIIFHAALVRSWTRRPGLAPHATLQLLGFVVCKSAKRRNIAAARWLTPSWKRRSRTARNLIDPDAPRRNDVDSRQRAPRLKGKRDAGNATVTRNTQR